MTFFKKKVQIQDGVLKRREEKSKFHLKSLLSFHTVCVVRVQPAGGPHGGEEQVRHVWRVAAGGKQHRRPAELSGTSSFPTDMIPLSNADTTMQSRGVADLWKLHLHDTGAGCSLTFALLGEKALKKKNNQPQDLFLYISAL